MAKANFNSFLHHFQKTGFPAIGAVDFELALPEYQEHAKRYEAWIARGSQGEMGYLSRGLERRLNPKLVFPELESAIVVLEPYSANPVGTEKVRYARYLNGRDYHETLHEKLQSTMEHIQNELPDLKFKVCVDTSAVLERTWASLCGLGWIGKNTLLIHPQLGSYLFIGVVFTNQSFGLAPRVHPDYCGTCTRCLTACPTQAFLEPHYLESRKCISYLTLEKRGEWDHAPDLKGFVAGCDVCQEVCPFNSKVSKALSADAPVADYLETDLEKLKLESEEGYRARTKGTALSRIKFKDFKRNISGIES